MLSDELFVEKMLENFLQNIFGEVTRLGLDPLCAWIDLDYWP